MNTQINPNNAPMIFNYGDNIVRSVNIADEPWFVGKDVCKTLGLTDHNKSLSRLDPDERRGCQIVTPSGKQDMVIINESGVYHLIFRSNKPEAKAFRKWVTSEVLPAIRKEGKYDPMSSRKQELKDLRKKKWGTISAIRNEVKAINNELELIDANTIHQCQHCGKVFKSAKSLQGHIIAAHKGGAERLAKHRKSQVGK